MKMQQTIQAQIEKAYSPSHIEVINESHMHSVPPGSESHFKLVVVSDRFEGMRLVQRHQSIYKVLEETMKLIHALALHTYTPEEWQGKTVAPDSPDCKGGSKAG